MSKYNLIDLTKTVLEEMRPKDKEFEDAKKKQGYLDTYGKQGEKDLKTIDKIRAMMAKEKSSQNEDAVSTMTAGLTDKDGIKNNMKERGGMLNITDPDNPKMTTFKGMITGFLRDIYPSAEESDLNAFYSQLMYNEKRGYLKFDGLDVAEEFEQFALDNNIQLRDPQPQPEPDEKEPTDSEELDEIEMKNHFNRFK